MRTRLACLIVTLILLSFVSYGQQEGPSDVGIVVFDPLFWKDELKLDDVQCRKIREINSEYYTRLYSVVQEDQNHQSVRVKAAESLMQRSEEIWDTFYPRQRKRWRKMWQEYYLTDKTNHT